MKTSQLIAQLTRLMEKHGDLPCGGEGEYPRVSVCACDEDGHDADGVFASGPATTIFLEVT